MFNLTQTELSILRKLSTPIKIQDFLDTVPINFEKKGETHMSPRRVLRERKAHCIEGALLAAAALWLHGHEPLIMELRAYPKDDDHVIALYKINGLWGAISKSNHSTVRFRDPIYKTIRELALSYFHEYFLNANGKKVLHSYSKPLNLKRLGTAWITSEKELWFIDKALTNTLHTIFYPKQNRKYIRTADAMERKTGKLTEWKK